jgi:hypothetical protein
VLLTGLRGASFLSYLLVDVRCEREGAISLKRSQLLAMLAYGRFYIWQQLRKNNSIKSAKVRKGERAKKQKERKEGKGFKLRNRWILGSKAVNFLSTSFFVYSVWAEVIRQAFEHRLDELNLTLLESGLQNTNLLRDMRTKVEKPPKKTLPGC